MKKVFKYAFLLFAVCAPLSLTSCSDDDDNDSTKYSDKTYGNEAIDACLDLCNALREASSAITNSNLTDDQKAELQKILENTVDVVIVPTYTDLGTAVKNFQGYLGDLSASEITQTDVDNACAAFKEARALWEKSEAFLGGAASDFDIDPHIDSWPLNRELLHSYFKSGSFDDEMLEDASILGFHALEFILFRDGQPRKVAEFSSNDTYNGFTDVKGSEELKYAEVVAKDLLNHVYELQVSWQETPDASRLAAVQAAGLESQTSYGKSYGWNMKNSGSSTSTFANIQAAIQQVLSDEEGSAWAISNEVGTAKIANPFSAGDISYVESPYSYNSITDFQNNIRSIENVWYGGVNGKSSSASYSFHKFFQENATSTGTKVETAIQNAIDKIGAMPAPFVKYVSTVWNKKFDETPVE